MLKRTGASSAVATLSGRKVVMVAPLRETPEVKVVKVCRDMHATEL